MQMQNQILMLKGAISMMSTEDQAAINECVTKLNELVDSYENGPIALALVGLERSKG